MLTWWHSCDRPAQMVRLVIPASARQQRAGRVRVLLAFSAILGQLLIATAHEAERAVAAHASGVRSDLRIMVGADAGHAARPHDPAQCPSCQAAAHGRSALGAASIAQLPLPPRREVVRLVAADVPAPVPWWTAAPRAPPA
jgi:hypothetical protein